MELARSELVIAPSTIVRDAVFVAESGDLVMGFYVLCEE